MELDHFLPMGRLARKQECFHQFTLAADRDAGKSFEPIAGGDFGIGIAPVAEQAHLIEAEFSLPDAESKMLDQRARELLAADFRHGRYASP